MFVSMLLPKSYFQNQDVLFLAKDLLGKVLITNIEGQICSGIIVETEAYRAPDDKACHAYNNRKTERTKTMFLDGGHAYIYLCYGMHHLLNVVTATEGNAQAVLIRAIEPLDGIEQMKIRRKTPTFNLSLTKGPGNLTKAFGIDKRLNETKFYEAESAIQIYDENKHYSLEQIAISKRIGVDYAEECAHWLWRYYVKENPYVS